jgi:hypothetical protein
MLKLTSSTLRYLPCGTLVAAALLAPTVSAFDAGPVVVHGSISLTSSYSDTYNFLGNTHNNASLNLVDVVVNGAHRFENGLRVGAQLYAYKVGDTSDITLDWANADYSFTQYLGIRIGRNKLPLGLYNDSQDLDAVRTFASLPMTFYPKTYRAITTSFDGAVVYGNIGIGKAGSIDYQAYGGTKEAIRNNGPFLRSQADLTVYDKFTFKEGLYGISLFWNTPIDGLRAGWSYLKVPKCEMPGKLGTIKELSPNYASIAKGVDTALGAGTWDSSGLFAGTATSIEDLNVWYRVYSIEYTHGKWTIAGEYKLFDVTKATIVIPAMALLGQPARSPLDIRREAYYVMATYQATDKIGLGLYYSCERMARNRPGAGKDPNNYTNDWAAAISYSINDNWVIKAEAHLIDGLSMVNNNGDTNTNAGSDKNWGYYAVKTTFSF